MNDDPLISSRNMRRQCGGISAMTEHRWRKRGILPAPVVINGRNYYPASIIESIKKGRTAS